MHPDLIAALRAGWPIVHLVTVSLPGHTIRWTDAGFVRWGGQAWRARDSVYGTLDGISDITDGIDDDAEPVTISIIPPDLTALGALASVDAQGGWVVIHLSAVHPDTGELVTPYQIYVGELDQPRLVPGKTRVLEYDVITGDARGLEPNEEQRQSNAFRQLVWPGERGDEYATDGTKIVYWREDEPRNAIGILQGRGGNKQDNKAIEFSYEPNAPLVFPFGRVAVSGSLRYRVGYGPTNRYQSVVATVGASGPVKGLVQVSFDDEVTQFDRDKRAINGSHRGEMWFSFLPGEQPSTNLTSPTGPNAYESHAPGWLAPHRLSGRPCFMWTGKENSKKSEYQGGLPKPLLTLDGLFGYDPLLDSTRGGVGTCRLDNPTTWPWIEEGARAALNWAIGRWEGAAPSGRYGVPYQSWAVGGIGAPIQTIDVSAFTVAAQVADGNGWRMAGAPRSDEDKIDVLERMLKASGAVRSRRCGMLSCVSFGAPVASVLTATAADTVAVPKVNLGPSRLDRRNTGIPSFLSAQHNWEVVPIAAVTDTDWFSEDGGRQTDGYEYVYVPAAQQAAQLCYLEMAHERERVESETDFQPWMMQLEPGAAFDWDEPEYGLTDIKVRVRKRVWSPEKCTVRLLFRQETDAKYAKAFAQTGSPPPAFAPPLKPVVDIPATRPIWSSHPFPITGEVNAIKVLAHDAMMPWGEVVHIAAATIAELDSSLIYGVFWRLMVPAEGEPPLPPLEEGEPPLGEIEVEAYPATGHMGVGGWVFLGWQSPSDALGVFPPLPVAPPGHGGTGETPGLPIAGDTTHVGGVEALALVASVATAAGLAEQAKGKADALELVYGDTASAAASAIAAAEAESAAVAAKAAALLAQGVAEGAAQVAATQAGLATTAKDGAEGSAAAALTSRNQSASYAADSEAAATSAQTMRNEATASRDAAQGSASAAATSATTATAKATEAETFATAAASAKTQAETARGQSQTYRDEAVAARDTAQSSATTATSKAGLATDASSAAAGFAAAAQGHASSASSSASAAGVSASAAEASRLQAGIAKDEALAALLSQGRRNIVEKGRVNGTLFEAASTSGWSVKLIGGSAGSRTISVGPLKRNTAYSLSFKARRVAGSESSISIDLFPDTLPETSRTITSSSFVAYVWEGITSAHADMEGSSVQLRFFKGSLAAGNEFEITDIKLEEGAQATAWTPAPRDIELAVKAAATSAAQAGASETAAGSHASAAQGHATTAGTRASEAQTYRDQASSAQAAADGSASAASLSAGAAASARDAASASKVAAEGAAATATTQAANASSRASSAEQSAQIAARVGTGGGWHRSPTWADWTSGNLPPSSGLWTGANISSTSRVAGFYGSALEVVSANGNDGGVSLSSGRFERPGPCSHVVVDYEVTLVAGNLRRSCLYVEISGSPNAAAIHSLYSAHGAGVVGQTYRGSALVVLNNPVTDPAATGLYLLNAHSGASGGATGAKTLRWHRANAREATATEIEAGKVSSVQAAITATQAVAVNAEGIAKAIAGLMFDVDGKISGWRSENDGSNSLFEILSDVFRLVSADGSTEFTNGIWYTVNAGVRTSWGKSHGVSGQGIVWWTGPNSVAKGAESKSNAYVYVSMNTTGGPRFGGSDVPTGGDVTIEGPTLKSVGVTVAAQASGSWSNVGDFAYTLLQANEVIDLEATLSGIADSAMTVQFRLIHLASSTVIGTSEHSFMSSGVAELVSVRINGANTWSGSATFRLQVLRNFGSGFASLSGPARATVYAAATSSQPGFMTPAQAAQLAAGGGGAHGNLGGGSLHAVATPTTAGFQSGPDKSKLDGIAAGATQNSSDTYLRNRGNHTGTQAWGTITGAPAITAETTTDSGVAGQVVKTTSTGNIVAAGLFRTQNENIYFGPTGGRYISSIGRSDFYVSLAMSGPGFNPTSDPDLKDNIVPVSDDLAALIQILGIGQIEYDRVQDSVHALGFNAKALREANPLWVVGGDPLDPEGPPEELNNAVVDEDGVTLRRALAVDPLAMLSSAFAAIRQMANDIGYLESRHAAALARIEALEAVISNPS